MALTPGTRLGAYEVLALLGSGGMGEVYRARDTRLDRVVAIKILPGSVADPDRRQRFDREARAISGLNHPHICTLYDVGHHDGVDYFVMELLEGQTLSERLAKGALPLDQALAYAVQIADALDAAHRHGIVHRDLKPANVMLTRTGATLLDFGIATPVAPVVASAAETVTGEGALLGTPRYMAPEQLEGRNADPRSDLFAFGAVLYEMVTGRRAFAGETPSRVIADVLDSDPPPLSASGSQTPPALEHLVKTCLAKDPDERWQTAGDIRRQLEWIVSAQSAPRPAAPGRHPRGGVLVPWAVALVASLAALVAGGALTWYFQTGSRDQATPRVTRTTIATSGVMAVSLNAGRSVAITPDGSRVVYVGNNGGQLFIRPIDRLDSTSIFTGALPLNEVFISPDGQSVAFGEGNSIKTMALTGGPAQMIVRGNAGYGGVWAPDGTIIFPTTDQNAGLQQVSATGGAITTLTRPDAAHGELAHVWPRMLPGGRAVLFTITAITGGLDAAQVAVLDLETRNITVLVKGGSDALYVSSGPAAPNGVDRGGGHLVYMKGSALMAVPFDRTRLEVQGPPVPVLPRLAAGGLGSGHFDAAGDGTLVYVDADARNALALAARTLVWVDRQRRETPLSASLPPGPYAQPRVSPDGKLVAMSISGQGFSLWDIGGQKLRKLSGTEVGLSPAWTMDSKRLVFGRAGTGLFSILADGTGKVVVLNDARGPGMLPSGVTPDGTRVLFSRGARDVMAMALDTALVESLVETPFDERNGVVSPDGRWLVYESKSTEEQFEIYVAPYPDVKSATWKVSGGTRPLWAPDGQELFFVAPDRAIMGVRVQPRGRVWSASEPVKILGEQYATGAPGSFRNYDISHDGKKFLMVKPPPALQFDPPQIELVQHWAEELKRLVPATR